MRFVLKPASSSAALLVRLLGREPRLHPAAESANHAGRHHAFGRTADAHQEIRRSAREQRRERTCHVAVGRRDHAGPGPVDLLDQRGVSRLVEDHHADLLDGLLERVRDPREVGLWRISDVDRLAGRGRTTSLSR
jgi:hypothetical protein